MVRGHSGNKQLQWASTRGNALPNADGRDHGQGGGSCRWPLPAAMCHRCLLMPLRVSTPLPQASDLLTAKPSTGLITTHSSAKPMQM